jgi:uncharacterized protein (TIGR03437 family)
MSPAGGVLVGRSATATISLQRNVEAPLTIFLRTQTGAAAVPSSVAIPAGQSQVSFAVRGERIGVEELSAEASDSRYATGYARVQVSEGVGGLHLEVVSGDRQAVTPGRVLPQPVVLRVLDRNNLPYPNITVNAVFTPGGTVSPAQATSDPDGLARFMWTPGSGQLHDLRATIDGNAGSTILVTALGSPAVSAGGIVNAASYVTGIVPGSLASIFGVNLASGALASATLPLPTVLAGTRVMVNGQAATLLYVSDRQINFVVPRISGSEAEVVVTSGVNARTEPVRVPMRAADPGIFVLSENLGAVLIAGTALTTAQRPARTGDILEIYCTGLGETSMSDNGITETVVRPQVSIGGLDAEVLYSGPAPGFAGLYQVNARVVAGSGAGPRPLVMRSGAASSNSVTVMLAE